MKKITWLLLILCLISCSSKEATTEKSADKETFVFSGKINPAKADVVIKVIAADNSGGRFDWLTIKTDSKGNFFQQITLKQQDFYLLNINNELEELILFTGEDITLDIDLLSKKVKYLHSLENQLNKQYDSLYATLNTQREAILAKYQNDMYNHDLAEEYNSFIKEAFEQMKSFITKHNAPLVSLRILEELDRETEIEFFEKTLAEMAKKYPTNRYVKSLQEAIQKSKATAVGQVAPDITLTSPDGKQVKLSSLRGKVVLIDFWASWCGPCRKENPNVVKLYEKYKNRGFEIYGVSLDRDRQAWIDAIKQDGLSWIHVSDLKFWQSEAAKLYNVSAIPMTVLLDKEGRIIAKNLRGKALEEALEKAL